MAPDMESWTFPPSYSDEYVPAASSRYWFSQRETMNAGERERAILLRLREICGYAYANSAFYKRCWDQAGFHPNSLGSLEEFEDRVPVITKRELRESQAKAPPFGDYLCIPEKEIFHVHGTSGTTGQPTAFAIGRNDWTAIANAHARVMWAMGMRPGDMICIAAILSLYMGSWGALAGAERLGAQAFPFGAGAPGMTARCAQWLDALKPAGFYGTPTYALHLAQVGDRRRPQPARLCAQVHVLLRRAGCIHSRCRDRLMNFTEPRFSIAVRWRRCRPGCMSQARTKPRECCAGKTSSTRRSAILNRCDVCLMASVGRRFTHIWNGLRSR